MITVQKNIVSPEYIAGLWDGEGTITIGKTNKSNGCNIRLSVTITITNTDLKLINAVIQYLDSYNLKYSYKIRKSEGNRKQQYSVWINKREYQVVFLQSINPFLIGKKEQCELVLLFLNMREKNVKKRKLHPCGKYVPIGFNQEEHEIRDKVSFLNKRGT